MRISDWSSDVCSSDLLGLSLAREADDEGGADGEVRADRTPALDAFKRLVYRTRPLHQLQHARAGVLERDVEVRQQRRHAVGVALRHQRDDVVDRSEEHTSELQSLMRISYDVFCLKKKKN